MNLGTPDIFSATDSPERLSSKLNNTFENAWRLFKVFNTELQIDTESVVYGHTSIMPDSGAVNPDHDKRYYTKSQTTRLFAPVSSVHDPVTVSDTSSLDLTLTGQQISGVVLPAGIDHGGLSGLSDNDHTQYVNAVSDTATIDLTLTGQSISGATIAAGIFAQILTVDGHGSGLDADLFEGQHGSYYAPASAISGTQYKLARYATTSTLGDGPFLCASDNSTVGLLDNIKLTFGTDIDSSIMDNNTNMVFTRETAGAFNFSGGPILVNTTTDVATARAVVLDGTGNNQLALAFSATKYLAAYVDGSSNTYWAPDGTTSSVFGGTGWFTFGVNARIATEKMRVQDNSGNYQLILSNSETKYTGLYVGAAGEFYIQPNGSGAVLVNASGNVSIGNTNDTYKLDVSGAGRFQGTAGAPLNTGSTQTNLGLRVWADAATDVCIDFGCNYGGSTALYAWMQAYNPGDLSTEWPLSINPFGGTISIGMGTALYSDAALSIACNAAIGAGDLTPYAAGGFSPPALLFARDIDAGTDNTVYMLDLEHYSSSDAATTLGVGMRFKVGADTVGYYNGYIGYLNAVNYSDGTAFDFYTYNYVAAAIYKTMTIAHSNYYDAVALTLQGAAHSDAAMLIFSADGIEEHIFCGNYDSHGVGLYITTEGGNTYIGYGNGGGDVYIGKDGTDYSHFEADGTLSFAGAATVFDDIQFQISAGKVPAANTPTFETFTANTKEYSFAVDDYIDLDANEMPHSWKEGTRADFHMHITTKAANTSGGNQYAKFTVYVAYAETDGTWSETPFTQELTIANGTAALTLKYLDLGDLTLTGYNLSTELKVRLKRIAATTGTEYPGNIFVTQIGAHFEKDTVGSRGETAK